MVAGLVDLAVRGRLGFRKEEGEEVDPRRPTSRGTTSA